MECIYGNSYAEVWSPEVWTAPSSREAHLFDTEESCCEAWNCRTEAVAESDGEGRWLAHEDGTDCVYLVLPASMLYADFLFETRGGCCAVNPCLERDTSAPSPGVGGDTNAPSASPTTRSDSPVAPPAQIPDGGPPAPAVATLSPTGAGTPVGPVTTRSLSMTIAGVGAVDGELWSGVTADYIVQYFGARGGSGAFRVDVEISVTGQEFVPDGRTGEASRAEKAGERRSNLFAGTPPKLRRRRNQETNGGVPSVRIVYDQVSAFVSLDPSTYDAVYVARTPFATVDAREDFAAYLREVSPEYAAVVSVSGVEYAPPSATPAASGGNEAVGGGGPSGGGCAGCTAGIVSGALCGAALLVVIAVLLVRRRNAIKSMHREAVGNGYVHDLHDLRLEEDVRSELGDGNPTSSTLASSSEFGVAGEKSAAAVHVSSAVAVPVREPPTTNASANGDAPEPDGSPPIFEAASLGTSAGTEDLVEVVAPAGKLGVIVDMHPTGPPAYVCEVKGSSPLLGELRRGDTIVAVDGEDVQTLSAVSISKLLARKSRNARRRITVLRERDGPQPPRFDGRGCGRSSARPPPSSPAGADAAAGGAITPPGSDAGGSDRESRAEVQELDIVAPSGRLGVVLVTPDESTAAGGGASGPSASAYVFNIREDSPLLDVIQLGDRVIKVDGRDVSGMTAVDVSRLLGSKSGQEARRITVLREVGQFDDIGDVDGVQSGTPPNATSGGPAPIDGGRGRTPNGGAHPPGGRRGSEAPGADPPGRGAATSKRPPPARARARATFAVAGGGDGASFNSATMSSADIELDIIAPPGE